MGENVYMRKSSRAWKSSDYSYPFKWMFTNCWKEWSIPQNGINFEARTTFLIKFIWDARREKQKLIFLQYSLQHSCPKNNDDERGWRKIPNEREIFAGKEHCLEPWSGRSSETWVERYFELAKKDVSNLQEVATPGARDHQIFPEAFEMNGELSAVSAQMVLSSLYLERIGRPDLLWSVNTLSRPVPKWNKISDKSLLRLTSCIGQTPMTVFSVMWEISWKIASLFSSKMLHFAGVLRDSKSTSGGFLWVFGSHTMFPISWMCKKQTAVSHSGTESEVIALDAG